MVEDTLEKWTLVHSNWLERNISVDCARRMSAWYDGMSFTTMATDLPHEIEAISQLASPSKPWNSNGIEGGTRGKYRETSKNWRKQKTFSNDERNYFYWGNWLIVPATLLVLIWNTLFPSPLPCCTALFQNTHPPNNCSQDSSNHENSEIGETDSTAWLLACSLLRSTPSHPLLSSTDLEPAG